MLMIMEEVKAIARAEWDKKNGLLEKLAIVDCIIRNVVLLLLAAVVVCMTVQFWKWW